jgi:hypothetical protein
MRWLLPLLLAALLTLAISLTTSAGAERGGAVLLPPRAGPVRLFCRHPRTLRLHRYEDRSARLECGGRAIARVSVPG